MKKVQIYGTGCAKCQALAANAEEAAQGLGIDIELDKVTDIRDIAAAGVLMTPGLAIDGQVKSTGHLLSVQQIRKLLE